MRSVEPILSAETVALIVFVSVVDGQVRSLQF